MDVRDALRTTGAARSFTDLPVGDDEVAEILDDASFAPSGGNRQPWRVAVVRDPAIRRTIAKLMQPVWDRYVAVAATGATPFAMGHVPEMESAPASNTLLDRIDTVPVVLAVAADLRDVAIMDRDLGRPSLTGGASIYPFCWSILLAARSRGVGGVLTTFLSNAETAAAPLLGLPADHALAATMFLGYVERFPTKLRRRDPATFVTVDRFDGPPMR